MKKFTLTLAILFCLLALMPAASPVAAKDNWISVRSKNFFLIGNGGEKQVRQVAARLEQFREVFSKLFPGAVISTPVPTTVVVFKSDSSYGPFKPNANIAGYFQSGEDVNYITLLAEVRGQQDPFSIIFHEYTHLMVNNTLGNVPTWLNEGLAEYYSTFSITDDQKVVLGAPIGNHVLFLRQSKMLPLRTLFQVDPKSQYYNERDKRSVFYAQSWALLHYLLMGKNGQRVDQMGKFVEATARNVPMEDAFQQAFAMTFEDMEKELKEYIKNDRYRIISGHFERKLDVDTEMQVAPITEAQAQAYLGDLLLHLNNAGAEAYLQKALSLDPDLAMAHASLAMLRVRQGKPEEALKSLEKAVAADTKNYLIHYYYAYAMSRAGKDSTDLGGGYSAERASKMRAALDKAIALRPDFVESYSLLAFLNLVTGTRLDESIEILKKAQSLARGRNDLSFMLAQLYVAKRDYKTAREMLQKINASNSGPELLQRAQSLLTQIASAEEYEARFRHAGAPNSGERLVLPTTEQGEQNDVKPPDPSSYLREALRKPQAGETQAQGTLVKIDCDGKGVTFVVRLTDRVIKLRASSFESIELVSFSGDSGGEITCGPRKPENNVVVSYTGSTGARSNVDGIAKSLEFVPPDFKLKP